jgi:hypothetical protein
MYPHAKRPGGISGETLVHQKYADCDMIDKNTNIAVFVIPGLTRNPLFFQFFTHWMPDQVRHDRQKLNAFLNYDEVS